MSILRVIDANLNRATEGLRVCEDFVRFIENDKKTAGQFKSIRHDIVQACLKSKISQRALLAARNSARDVGRRSLIFDQKKTSVRSLVASNFKRAEQSVRVLEECFKIVFPTYAVKFQEIRFRIYELEKEVLGKF